MFENNVDILVETEFDPFELILGGGTGGNRVRNIDVGGTLKSIAAIKEEEEDDCSSGPDLADMNGWNQHFRDNETINHEDKDDDELSSSSRHSESLWSCSSDGNPPDQDGTSTHSSNAPQPSSSVLPTKKERPLLDEFFDSFRSEAEEEVRNFADDDYHHDLILESLIKGDSRLSSLDVQMLNLLLAAPPTKTAASQPKSPPPLSPVSSQSSRSSDGFDQL